jgi:hypothetical protein
MSMVAMNDTNKQSNCNFLMHKILSNVECLVLLHSPIIIDLEKLGTINKEVNSDKMDDDFTTQEMNNYFSSSEFVSGCTFKKEKNHSPGYMKVSSMDCTKKLLD